MSTPPPPLPLPQFFFQKQCSNAGKYHSNWSDIGEAAHVGSAWTPLVSLPEYHRLKSYFYQAADEFLRFWNLRGPSKAERTSFFWMTVHMNGSSHLPHIHKATQFNAVCVHAPACSRADAHAPTHPWTRQL